MKYSKMFGMKLHPIEQDLLQELAKRMERSRSDVIRVLIRAKARELGIEFKAIPLPGDKEPS